MMDIDLQEKELIFLENKIKKAEQTGEHLDKYVLRAIELLQQSLDVFVKNMIAAQRLSEPQVGEIEIRQYATMRELAKKINLPYSQYDDKIKEVQIRIFGEENWENFFSE